MLNAKDYGIPQNRERVFTISIRNDINQGYEFPQKQELKLRLKDLLEDEVDEKYYLSTLQIERIRTTTYNVGKARIQEKDYCDTLCARDWKDPKCVKIKNNSKQGYLEAEVGDGINISSRMQWQRGNVQKQISQTINTEGKDNGVLLKDYRIRKLTPKECWRLMGFSDEAFDKASKVNSNTQLYKQARKLNSSKCASRNIKELIKAR